MKKVKRTCLDILRFSVTSRDCTILATQILIGLVLSVAAFFLVINLSEDVAKQETIRYDHSILVWVHAWRTPMRTEAMLIVSRFGNEVTLFLAIVATITLTYQHHRRDAVIFLSILIIGILLNLVLKSTFDRPRPSLDPIVIESSYSFPSGHAMNATIFYTALSFFIFRRFETVWLRQLLLVGCCVLIGLIGFSRVYLGVHYPSDVIAGFAIGMIWFLLVLVLARTLRFFRLFRAYRSRRY